MDIAFLKGYRTVIFNTITGVVAVLAVLARVFGAEGTEEAADSINSNVSTVLDAILALLAIVIPTLNIWLRTITNSPVFKKTPDSPSP